MRVSLSLSFLLLMPGWAHADEPAHAVAGASARGAEAPRPGLVTGPPREFDDAAIAQTLEAGVAEVLDRTVERAAERTVSALEAREAERLGELDRSVARQIEERMYRQFCIDRLARDFTANFAGPPTRGAGAKSLQPQTRWRSSQSGANPSPEARFRSCSHPVPETTAKRSRPRTF